MYRSFVLLLSFLCFTVSFCNGWAMNIVADNSLSTTVNMEETEITGGHQVGANLFHSFTKFNIVTGKTVLFKGNTGLNNIFSRVTGEGQSEISGTLQLDTNIHDANFFLMNPNGITFSGNAVLDLSGSFYATTADFVESEGNKFYSAKDTLENTSTFFSAAPTAFGFLQSGGGGGFGGGFGAGLGGGNKDIITVENGSISADTAKSLVLLTKPKIVFGNRINTLTIKSGKIRVPSGKIILAQTEETFAITPENSALSSSEEQLNSASFDINQDIYIRGGRLKIENVNLGNPSFKGKIGIDLDGDLTVTNGTIQSTAPFTKEPTAIDINANNITLNTAIIDTSTSGTVETAGSIKITAQGTIDINSNSTISGSTSGSGGASSLIVNADIFKLQGNSEIRYTSASDGNAGEISIAANTINLANAKINNQTNGGGTGANIKLTKRPNDSSGSSTVTITDSTTISSSTAGSGNAGNFKVDTDQFNIKNSTILAQSFSSGNAGKITIEAEKINLTSATISNQTTVTGSGGTITLEGDNLNLTVGDGSIISSSTTGSGNAGDITVNNDQLTIQNSTILAQSFIDEEQNNSTGSGDAGDITITANNISMTNATFSNETTGTGSGGTITLKDAKIVTVKEGSKISSSTAGNAKEAGNLEVTTDQFTLQDSKILAESSSSGEAGNIKITANMISTTNGEISNETTGTGSGGTITLKDAKTVNVKEGSKISSSTTGNAKDAGNLEVTTDQFSIQNSEILAESKSPGKAGNISITANDISMTDKATISNETTGTGSGGTLILKGNNLVAIKDGSKISSSTLNEAKEAGDISVTTDQFSIQNSIIQAESKSSGNAGDITITANKINMADASKITNDTFQKGLGGTITIKGNNLNLNVSGSSQVSSATSGSGNAGKIDVTADKVNVQNAVIQATSSGSGDAGAINIASSETTLSNAANITSSTSSTGIGGKISIIANTIELNSNSRVSAESTKDSTGTGGDILVQAKKISVRGNSAFTTKSDGSGDAGRIDFRVASLLLNNAAISSAASKSDGGNIHIEGNSPSKFITLKNDSAITTSVNGGAQTTGGNIQINSEFVVVQNSRIIAEAFAGTGGNITITAQGLFVDPSSRISASSALGVDGIVDIDAKAEVIDDVVGLPENYMPNIELRQQTCAQRIGGGKSSSFTVLEKPGMPIGPEDLFSGDFGLTPEFASPQIKVDAKYTGACQGRKKPMVDKVSSQDLTMNQELFSH
jgi:filamentous hemagglutinin family protein